jgi:hypothetical protein
VDKFIGKRLHAASHGDWLIELSRPIDPSNRIVARSGEVMSLFMNRMEGRQDLPSIKPQIANNRIGIIRTLGSHIKKSIVIHKQYSVVSNKFDIWLKESTLKGGSRV